MHVAAVGSRSGACGSKELPAICIDRPGSKYLKPNSGARLHAVTNFNSCDCCSAVNSETTCSVSTGASAEQVIHSAGCGHISRYLRLGEHAANLISASMQARKEERKEGRKEGRILTHTSLLCGVEAGVNTAKCTHIDCTPVPSHIPSRTQ